MTAVAAPLPGRGGFSDFFYRNSGLLTLALLLPPLLVGAHQLAEPGAELLPEPLLPLELGERSAGQQLLEPELSQGS